MSTLTQETEVKLYIAAFDDIIEALNNAGAELIQERVHERNMRYENDEKSLTNRGIVVRLREDVDITLTYKGTSSVDNGIMTREELEVQVSDYDVMEQILDRLGYYPFMYYEKYRTIYALNNTQIMLDEMPFGKFVEVEGEKEAIEQTLSQLNLNDVERRPQSYSKLFDFVKHHLELDFKDLTFENFAEIDVPESAFIPPGSIVIK